MITTLEIAWLAGLLEGEGSFGFYGTCGPRVFLSMTDKDVVQHAASLLHVKRINPRAPLGYGKKLLWVFDVAGIRAVGIMLTVYKFLGTRRQEKIRDCLAKWRKKLPMTKYRTHCPSGHEYNEQNTYSYKGTRLCRACQSKHKLEHRKRLRAA
jgi:hypothetical protein